MKKQGWLLTSIGLAVPGLAALVTYLDGWQKVAEAFTSLHDAMQTATGIQDLHRGVTASIIGVALAVVALSAWLPVWRKRRRAESLKQTRAEAERLLAKAQKERFFRLDPQPPPETDDAPLTFDRADVEHQEILKWIRRTKRPVIYVTGQSGTGKSSLMGAYVVPALNRGTDANEDQNAARIVAVIVRAFGDLDATIRDAIGAPGRVWIEPPDLSGTTARAALERAAKRLEDQDTRLVLVFDQFEEVIVGESPEKQALVPALALVKSLCERRIDQLTCVLVARAEYGDAFKSLGLPERIEGDTWRNVPAFSVGQAAAVLLEGLTSIHKKRGNDEETRNGLRIKAATLARQAEVLGKVPQYVTPIALNMSGFMYESDPALGHELAESNVNAADGVLATYVRGRVESGDIRDVGPAVLEQLVSPTGDRVKPLPLASIAGGCGVAEGTAETALLTLARYGLVRRIGETWEVSHDFLAPMLRRVLDRIKGSIWKRLRPLLPVAALTAVLFGGAGIWVNHMMEQIKIQRQREVDAVEFTNCITKVPEGTTLFVNRKLTPGAVRHIAGLEGKWTLRFNADFDKGGIGYGGAAFDEVIVNRSLQILSEHRGSVIPISTVILSGSKVAAEGLAALAAKDSPLTALTTLDLRGTHVTDAGLEALKKARPDLQIIR